MGVICLWAVCAHLRHGSRSVPIGVMLIEGRFGFEKHEEGIAIAFLAGFAEGGEVDGLVFSRIDLGDGEARAFGIVGIVRIGCRE